MVPALTAEELLSIPEPRDVCLAPNGKQVIYALQPRWCRISEHVTSSLWSAEVGLVKSTKQLTRGNYHHKNPAFSPDGKVVSFISDREMPGKMSVLYLLPGNGGEAMPLTDRGNEMTIDSYGWSPGGESIAFVSADEKSEKKKRREKEKDDAIVFGEDWEFGRLRVIDVKTKEVRTFTIEEHVGEIAWSESGAEVVYCTYKTPLLDDRFAFGASINILAVATGEVKHVCKFGSSTGSLSWVGDGIFWTGPIEANPSANPTTSAAVYKILPDARTPSVIASGEHDCAQGLRPCQGRLVTHIAHGLNEQLVLLASTRDLNADGLALYSGKHTIISHDANFRDEKLAVVVVKGSVGTPAEVFSIIDGHETQLSDHNATVAEMEIAASHLCEYDGPAGVPIDGYYAVPKNMRVTFDSHKPQRTIVLLRGGPYVRISDAWDVFYQYLPWFVMNDYLVLCPNYRGGAGHGNDYAKSVRGDPAKSYEDVIWLVKKGIEDGYIDEKRCAIAGWSQGGYLSYLSVTRDSTFHFATAIAFAGVTDWDMISNTSDLPTFESQLAGVKPWDSTAESIVGRHGSPLYHMHDIKTPMLLLHGREDVRVPVSQAVAFHRGMREKGKECEMVIYPREGHGHTEPFEKAHAVDMLERMLAFLRRHVG